MRITKAQYESLQIGATPDFQVAGIIAVWLRPDGSRIEYRNTGEYFYVEN